MEGGTIKCTRCEEEIPVTPFEERFNVCPGCEHHYEISARRRVQLLLDEGTFEEMATEMEPTDPLGFKGRKPYAQRLRDSQKRTSMKDACMVGLGRMNGREVAFGVTDPGFMRGSMGSVVGEKIAVLAEAALERRVPMVFVSGSGGGARMDEGMLSLMQMAKTSAAIARLKRAGVLYVSVLTHPTMGGAMASFAALGDVTLAEPGALLGFAGPNVIKQTIKTSLPDGFQRSEFLARKGFVDRIVHRLELKETISAIIDYCMPPSAD